MLIGPPSFRFKIQVDQLHKISVQFSPIESWRVMAAPVTRIQKQHAPYQLQCIVCARKVACLRSTRRLETISLQSTLLGQAGLFSALNRTSTKQAKILAAPKTPRLGLSVTIKRLKTTEMPLHGRMLRSGRDGSMKLDRLLP
jgi:hypothetical protein